MLFVRKTLDEFCFSHGLSLDEPDAIEAARQLMDITSDGAVVPDELRARLDEWWRRSRNYSDRSAQSDDLKGGQATGI